LTDRVSLLYSIILVASYNKIGFISFTVYKSLKIYFTNCKKRDQVNKNII